MRVRHALERYLNRVASLDQPGLETEYRDRLDILAQLMESCEGAATDRRYDEISLHLGWLEAHEQVPAIVAAVREAVARPNVRVAVAQEFISKVTSESIDRTDPMTDYILGTTVHGTSHTIAELAVVPAESREGVRLLTRLEGNARTWGRGYNGPVRANMAGTAELLATSEIVFGPEGFRLEGTDAVVSATGRPTSMWTVYRSRVLNGLVTRVGRKRAARTQEIGDCIASRHAEQRLERQVGDEVAARLAGMQRDYVTRFRNPLLRRDAFPPFFHTESDAETARAAVLIAAAHQLGAPSDPPTLDSPAAFALQLHESVVNNLAATLLAGKTVSEMEIRKFIDQLFGRTATESPVNERDVLYITLEDDRPISFRIDNQIVSVKVRAKQFIVNRRAYYPMNLLLRYHLEQTPRGIVASQASEPEITPPRFETEGPGRLATREVTSRRLILNMLDRELKKEYLVGEFVLPEPGDVFGPMTVTKLVAADGWLALSADASSRVDER